jgi:Archaeal fructose-1,6-bisphosphatase and related enzymes of inositol monophosphatase family
MYAKYNDGTYYNDKKIIINKSNTVMDSIGSVSSKYWDKDIENKIILLKNCFKKINSYGSIGCEYFDIVLGKRDFAILSKLSPWDHLSGVLMVREAGGCDSHFDKLNYKFNKKCKNLIVSNSRKLNMEIINKIERFE